MEKNVDIDCYITLSNSGIEATRKEARESAKATYGSEDSKDDLLYENVTIKADEMYFDRDSESILFNGEFYSMGKKLGYISPSIKISGDLIVEIIEHYMKKLGKLKTVMEAIK